jgi:hypothetical protein
MAHQPHLPRQAEGARHGAADLGRDAQRHRRRVRDEHRFDRAAVPEPEQELFGSVLRPVAVDDDRRADRELLRQHEAQVAREVGHRRDIRHTEVIHPAEDLACMEPAVSAGFEDRLERRTFQFGEISGNSGYGHGISRNANHLQDRIS